MLSTMISSTSSNKVNELNEHDWSLTNLQELAEIGQPVLLINAAKKWNQIIYQDDDKSLNNIINHFSLKDKFYFDVAPNELTKSNEFTYVGFLDVFFFVN